MSSTLARRFKLDVSTDNSTWVPFKGILDLAVKENPTIQTTTDFDTNGFESFEKTVTNGQVTIKARRPLTAGSLDPGQELVRTAGQFQFGTAARIYIRWYDRNNLAEAFSGYALVDWSASKTAAADVEEITVVFKIDGTVTAITNPVGSPQVPAILSITPAGVGTGGMIRITGAYFTGVTAAQVKSAAVAMTSIDVVSDSIIEAILPSQSAGSYAVTVTNGAGASAGFNYTRAA